MVKVNLQNQIEPNTGDECFPEIVFSNGDQNIIIRYVDAAGAIRIVQEYKRATATVKYFEPERRDEK